MVRHINPGGPSRLYSSWLKGNLVIGGGDVGPANEYFVSKDGHARNDGLSWERSKLLIQDGLDLCVGTGETVYVGPGAYTESLATPASATASAITLWGMGDSHRGQGAAVTSAAADEDALNVLCNNFTVRNMRLNGNTTSAALRLDSITGSAIHAITVDHCHFNGGLYGVECYGGSSFVTIKDSLFRFILEAGGIAIGCSDASATQPNVWEIENNIFWANANHISFTGADGPFNATIRYNVLHAAYFDDVVANKIHMGNGGGYNAVYANFCGGTFSHAGGYQEGGTGDNWYGNYSAAGIDSVTLPV